MLIRLGGRRDPLRWPRDTLYPQKLALTSPTSGGGSVGIVRLRTKGHGVFLVLINSYECGNGYLGFIKGAQFFDQLND
jgi:hypothetical protein